ncbi:MAG: type IV pilus assembly protein PilM [Phycisphaeraceae bacterium]|nr:type IV pilus assembly protein PilM [Phycisphaeraceae bacterium]
MRLPFIQSGVCPIGLDTGTHSIKMMQLERRGSSFAVRAAGSRALPCDLPSTASERSTLYANLIKQILAEGDFQGRRVVSCLPATSIQYKNLRLPRMPYDELRSAVEWEAADRLKIVPESMQVQFFAAGEVRQGEEQREEIIMLAATRDAINEHVDTLVKSDLKPVAIDAVPGALARTLVFHSDNNTDQDAPQMALDIGSSSSKVLVVRQGRVVFFKLIDIGGRKLDQTVAQNLSLPLADAADLRRRLQRSPKPEDGSTAGEQLFGSTRRESLERAVYESLRATASELAKEVSLCLRYYSVTFRGKRPEKVLLVGGETYEPQLARALAEGIDLPVEAIRPFAGVDISKATELDADGTNSEWAVAVGLSMRREAAAKRGAA